MHASVPVVHARPADPYMYGSGPGPMRPGLPQEFEDYEMATIASIST